MVQISGSRSDDIPKLRIADADVHEVDNGSSVIAAFVVTLQPASSETVMVDYTTAERATPLGKATENVDYLAVAGTLTFAPNATSDTIKVVVVGDDIGEPTEFYNVLLFNPVKAVFGDSAATGSIQDNDDQTSISDEIPGVTALLPTAPNPFRRNVTVSFSLAETGEVELTLYAVNGRRVRTLAIGRRRPGVYPFVWDGRDDRGMLLTSGIYYAHLSTSSGRFTRKIVYLK